jgi:hypothetical protein
MFGLKNLQRGLSFVQDRIGYLDREIARISNKEPMYSETPFPQMWGIGSAYYGLGSQIPTQNISLKEAVAAILEHLEMELVKNPESISLRKKVNK